MLSLAQPLLGQADLSAIRMAWHIWDKCATGGLDRHGVDLNQGSWKALLGTFEITFVYTVLKLR